MDDGFLGLAIAHSLPYIFLAWAGIFAAIATAIYGCNFDGFPIFITIAGSIAVVWAILSFLIFKRNDIVYAKASYLFNSIRRYTNYSAS